MRGSDNARSYLVWYRRLRRRLVLPDVVVAVVVHQMVPFMTGQMVTKVVAVEYLAVGVAWF